MESKITPISELDPDIERFPKMAEIRFDCYVKMFDYAQRTTKGGIFGQEKPLPPQWFRSEQKFTLEGIKHSDPHALGIQLKNMLQQLEDHISRYEEK